MRAARKPRLAVWKLTSCDGCQLALLDGPGALTELADAVDIAYFLEAGSATSRGPYDISLVEGSVSTPGDVAELKRIRKASRSLVAIGACATAGGIQALRNTADFDTMAAAVYPRPEYLDSLATSTAIADHVPVDHELQGCPVDARQLLDLITALLAGRDPPTHGDATCVDCKRRGLVCVTVAHGTPCLGPVTHAGCGALCPAVGRGCYGCFGPKDSPNASSLSSWWLEHLGGEPAELARAFSTFNAAAPEFLAAAEAHSGGQEGRRHGKG